MHNDKPLEGHLRSLAFSVETSIPHPWLTLAPGTNVKQEVTPSTRAFIGVRWYLITCSSFPLNWPILHPANEQLQPFGSFLQNLILAIRWISYQCSDRLTSLSALDFTRSSSVSAIHDRTTLQVVLTRPLAAQSPEITNNKQTHTILV